MSFTADIRGELARADITNICCARAELTAALLLSGGISWRGHDRYALTLTSANGAITRRYFTILKTYFGVTAQLRTLRAETLNGSTHFQLVVDAPEDARNVLTALDLLDDDALFGIRECPIPAMIESECDRSAFLRGAFLFCGAATDPEKEYMLEFSVPREAHAQTLCDLLKQVDLPAKCVPRKNKFSVYLKRSEAVSDALALIGAIQAKFALENVLAKKEMRNSVNRLYNCDNVNIDRVTEAALRQTEDILFIERTVGLKALPDLLREIADARLENPSASLTALGELLNPPVSKNGVNARMRRISEFAMKLRAQTEA